MIPEKQIELWKNLFEKFVLIDIRAMKNHEIF